MALTINTNVAALKATSNLSLSNRSLNKSFERLSSGLRVNSAADDAAGLSIASRLSAQVRGTNQAIRNSNDAISLIQVTEGALGETEAALQRIRELAVQASSDTMTSTDRDNIQVEVDELVSEIDRIAFDTQFNGVTLLSAGGAQFSMQVGANEDQQVYLSVTQAHASGLLGWDKISMGSATATSAITGIDTALDSVNSARARLGAMQNRFESIVTNLTSISEGTQEAHSRIMDADVATETANLTRAAIIQQAGVAILAQANQQPQLVLSLLG
uniref:Flagellin n=1 Tax=Magnetococcus massalia (strain MO-1) TaxID=451514 RepID=I3V6X4_MAGMO|nr:flagellin protein FliC12 [Candidatus Magnetococcus massalia]CRH07708.1 Flagellin [Candidatus Magnetococcus massalia]